MPKCGKVTILSAVVAAVIVLVLYRSAKLTPRSYLTAQTSIKDKVLQMTTLKRTSGDIINVVTTPPPPVIRTNVHSKVDLQHEQPLGRKNNKQAHSERAQLLESGTNNKQAHSERAQLPDSGTNNKQAHSERAQPPDTRTNASSTEPNLQQLPGHENNKQAHTVRTQSPYTRTNASTNVNIHTPPDQELNMQAHTGSDAMSIARSIPRIHPLSFYGKDLCLLYDRKPEYYRDKKLYEHPNIVHYIKLSQSERAIHTDLLLLDYVSILSVDRYYKPDKIVIHCNRQPTGKYWKMAQSLKTKIETRHADRPLAVGRLKKRPIAIPHEADILKSSIAYDEGGLIIDFDIVILNGEVVRKQQSISECVIGLERECTFVNAGFLSCVPRTKYIQTWRDSYENDYHNTWGGYLYNCGELTARTLRNCPSCYNVYVDPEVDMNPDAGAPGGPGPGRDPWKEQNGVQWKHKSVAHILLSHLDLPKDDKILSIHDCSYKDIVKFILGDDFVV